MYRLPATTRTRIPVTGSTKAEISMGRRLLGANTARRSVIPMTQMGKSPSHVTTLTNQRTKTTAQAPVRCLPVTMSATMLHSSRCIADGEGIVPLAVGPRRRWSATREDARVPLANDHHIRFPSPCHGSTAPVSTGCVPARSVPRLRLRCRIVHPLPVAHIFEVAATVASVLGVRRLYAMAFGTDHGFGTMLSLRAAGFPRIKTASTYRRRRVQRSACARHGGSAIAR